MKHIFRKISLLSILSFSFISLASCKTNGEYIKIEDKEEFETIEFGSFAQSVVTDKTIKDQLDLITEGQDELYFNTLKYIELDGENYVKGIVDPIINVFNRKANYAFYKFDYTEDSNGNVPVNNTYEYFKVEPIKFIKRTYNEETLYISEDILFPMQYSANTASKYDDEDKKVYYPNNYIKSDLRTYLNEDFYNMAFSDEEKVLINDHITKNDKASASPTAVSSYLPNKDCIDKVFIPSYDEMDKMFKNNISRSANTSDYARCQGVSLDYSETFYGNANYYTRSAYQKKKDYVNFVNNSGTIIDGNFDHGKVQTKSSGIRIVLSLNI
jgi:hypothetical protein